MKLVVRDVATLFSVSEKTVYRWISQGTLPAHRINDQYRFNRVELMEWASAQRVPVSPAIFKEDDPGTLPGLEEALQAGGVHYRVFGEDKPSVLAEVVRILPLPEEVDRKFLRDVLLARESLGSTGIGDGVAIPHVRSPIVMHIPRPIVSLCFLEHPIAFDAIDQKPVHTLFTIVSPTIRAHLNLLSRLSFAMQDSGFKETIRRQALREEVFSAAREMDARVASASGAKGGRSA